jgi:acetyl-CoA acetyltransferase
MDKACIAGIGETKYYKRGQAPESVFALACHAILNAVKDAGLEVAEVDGLVSYVRDNSEIDALASSLGMRTLRFVDRWPSGGGGVAAVTMNASMAVATGSANYVVCYRALSQGQEIRRGRARTDWVGAAGFTGIHSFQGPYGMLTPAQTFAPKVRRYMYETGATREDFAAVPLACNAHAQRNPRALMYGHLLTRQQYMDSRVIVDPFHLYDCCLECDGAVAFVVTTPERARDLKHKPVYVMAAVQGQGERQEFGYPNAIDYATSNLPAIAPELFGRSGLRPEDIDVAQIYETFVPLVVMAIEDLGFCGRGEGPDFIRDGSLLWPDGRLPMNTSGGNLGEAYTHGLSLVNEAVRQLRGTSTSQIEDAETCLVTGGPGANLVSAMILRR